MPVLLANVLISTSRSQASVVSGVPNVTGPALPVLEGALAHIEPTRSETDDLMNMPSGAVRTEMLAYVDQEADVRLGDYITSITLLDGTTPYPQLSLSGVPNEVFMVSFVLVSAPGPLKHRQLLISRYITGGQAYT